MANSTTPFLGPVVITGGCGFIGFHVAKGILKVEPNCQIYVVDINTSRNCIPGVTYHTCDITSIADTETVFAKAKLKTVFHVACLDSMVVLPDVFCRVNVDGTRNLLAISKNIKTVQAFIFTSTSSVIHDNISDLIDANEDLPVLQYLVQKRVYTLTKAEAEADVLAANRSENNLSMLTTSLRPATVFGERDTICMGKIVQTHQAGKGNIQFGKGNNEYDFVYVSNLVDAQILAAHALLQAYGKPALPIDESVDGQCFNITNNERVLFWEFQRAIGASIGLPVNKEDIKQIPAWIGLLMASVIEWITWTTSLGRKQPRVTWEAVRLTTITRTLNGEKARRVLGYEPRVSIKEGLVNAGKWFVEEKHRQGENKKAA